MSYQNVIVGGGLAGGMIAQEYREQGGDGSIVIIASEPHHPYHRPPLTKDFLRGEKPASDGDMHPPAWWRKNDIDVQMSTTAASIDPGAHTVTLEGGRTVEYERLALATGATPRTIPGTSSIRTIEDSQRVASVLEEGTGHLGVIGGGFIGVEAAASARMKGLDVTMAVPESVVWEHLFGPEVGRYFQDQLESHGVNVLTGTKELPERAYNLVLAGIGVNPNIEIAKAAGLDDRVRRAGGRAAVGRQRHLGGGRHRRVPERRARPADPDRALGCGAQSGRVCRP